MKRNFNQHLQDIEDGLKQIEKFIERAKNDPNIGRKKHDKAIENKNIQEARIDFFKRGYNLAYSEIKNQEKLDYTSYKAS